MLKRNLLAKACLLSHLVSLKARPGEAGDQVTTSDNNNKKPLHSTLATQGRSILLLGYGLTSPSLSPYLSESYCRATVSLHLTGYMYVATAYWFLLAESLS